MKIDDVLNYYGTAWAMQKKHGLSHSNIPAWRKRGYIPIETQLRIEKLTEGALKADLNDCKG